MREKIWRLTAVSLVALVWMLLSPPVEAGAVGVPPTAPDRCSLERLVALASTGSLSPQPAPRESIITCPDCSGLYNSCLVLCSDSKRQCQHDCDYRWTLEHVAADLNPVCWFSGCQALRNGFDSEHRQCLASCNSAYGACKTDCQVNYSACKATCSDVGPATRNLGVGSMMGA